MKKPLPLRFSKKHPGTSRAMLAGCLYLISKKTGKEIRFIGSNPPYIRPIRTAI